MGENSKKIGDNGEGLIRGFLKSVGWGPLTDSFDLKCEFPGPHKLKGSQGNRTFHGVDLAYSYICPIIPDFRRNVLISVKNSRSEKTTPQPTKIRDDLTDLSTALKCFKRAPARREMLASGGGPTTAEDLGLLIKINKDGDPNKRFADLTDLPERLDVENGDAIYFLENARFDFVEAVMHHVEIYGSGRSASFMLPKTSANISADTRKTSSSFLPIQSLIGGSIAIRLEGLAGQDAPTLMLYSQEPYSIERFRRLASLGLDLSTNWVDVICVFPDFKDLSNSVEVSQALSGMVEKDYAKRVKCMSLNLRARAQ